VWPATAAAFGLFDGERGRQTMRALAVSAITTDWGARMLSAASELYDPLHYNMGAVWPFVTGFVALGHYEYERPWSAFPLVEALAQLTFDFARGRHVELLSGAYYRPLDTAVPHQFLASSMLVSPIVSGMLGWSPDAPRRRDDHRCHPRAGSRPVVDAIVDDRSARRARARAKAPTRRDASRADRHGRHLDGWPVGGAAVNADGAG